MSLNESIGEHAALEWFGELGYAVGYGPHIGPGKAAAKGTLTTLRDTLLSGEWSVADFESGRVGMETGSATVYTWKREP